MKKPIAPIVACLVVGLLAAGCGSDSGEGGGESLASTWLYTGPEDDGGYNLQLAEVMNTASDAEEVDAEGIFEVPYSQRATQITEQAIAKGSDIMVETLGLSELFTGACEQAPQVYCFAMGDPAPQPDNSRSFFLQDWNLQYAAGVASGLMSDTGKLGVVASFDIPLSRMAVNSYALGCQHVNPHCEVSVIFINAYFDPAKTTQASATLVDLGADVIRNYIDDPSFCKLAEKRGVYAVGEFADFHDACPDSIITSTLWDWDDYFIDQFQRIKNGSFKGGGLDIVPVTESDGGPHLGQWGAFVPDDVKEQVDRVFAQMAAGKRFIIGPIYNQDGELQVAKGEEVSDEFLFNDWTWFVEGVTAQ